jgi:hypothetical protein
MLLGVTLDGLPLTELGKLFAIFGGAMLVLYILKLRRRRVQVPFSPLWSRVVVEKQSSSLFKALKRIGSLLVQLAIIALVVLALGDPNVAGAGSIAGCTHEEEKPPPPRHALLILDASASMATVEGGKTRLERARDEAADVINKLAIHPTQKVMMVQLDATTRPLTLWTSDPAVLTAALSRYGRASADGMAQALDTPTAIDDAMRLATDALRGREGAQAIFVTDRAFEPIDISKLESLDFRVVPVGGASDNVGIEAFNVRPYLDDSVTYVAWYAVRNESARTVKASLHVYANPLGSSEVDFDNPSRLVHTEPLLLPPNDTLRNHIPELKFQGSRLMAKVVVDTSDPTRDAFSRDDLAFAVVPERKVLKVQLVSEGNLFVHAALYLRENIALTAVTPAEYKGPEGFDVTVVDTVDIDISRPGNYFLIEPPAGAAKGVESFQIKGRMEQPLVQKVDKKHPLSRHLGFADANILEMPVYTTVRGDEVVASAQNGAPLLFARKFPDGRRAVVLSFDVRKSLLPMNYAFPILVVNAISWFAQDADGLLQPNRAGLPLSLAYKGTATSFTVKGPVDGGDGVNARRIGERVHFTAPRLGIFQIVPGPSAPGPAPGAADADPAATTNPGAASDVDKPLEVAINLLSPEESRIAPRGEYPAWSAPVWTPPVQNEWLAELWRVLLLIALGVVLIEWFTWHRRWTV